MRVPGSFPSPRKALVQGLIHVPSYTQRREICTLNMECCVHVLHVYVNICNKLSDATFQVDSLVLVVDMILVVDMRM